MKLLMHTCCAPCSVYCIDELRLMGIEPTLYWYNPNIHPYTEYVARRDCVKEYAKRVGVDVIFNDEYGLDEFCKNVANNLNARCVNYCYPVRLRKTFEYAKANNEIKKILWAPRWTYDEKIGKSHFFEYKDKFNELSKKYPNILFTIRPHPMMFSNFIKSGLMTEEEFLHYKKELELLGIELSLNKDVSEDLKTTDILISDFSSIIPMFYFMNKPVIYTDADMALNEEYCIIMDNSYIADNWNKVREYIDDLVNGIDLKSSQRYADIKEQYKLHHEASRRIVDCLVNDYIKNEMEA